MRRMLVSAALAAASWTTTAAAQRAPTTGEEVLQRMHDAYAGKWYHTLTFTQQTTMYRPGQAEPVVQTWYESLRHTKDAGTQLRIDLGEPGAGNGVLYTADSSWRMRAGKLASASASGNEFLPMIEGVYVQPVATTVAQVKPTGVDMQRVHRGTWEGRPVWVVGASTPSDTTSPQFWVDAERNVVVRMILVPSPGQPTMDIHLGKYERAGKGWLATKVEMLIGGAPRQTEEYSGWKTDIPLDPGLFAPASWTTAKHWAP